MTDAPDQAPDPLREAVVAFLLADLAHERAAALARLEELVGVKRRAYPPMREWDEPIPPPASTL